MPRPSHLDKKYTHTQIKIQKTCTWSLMNHKKLLFTSVGGQGQQTASSLLSHDPRRRVQSACQRQTDQTFEPVS